MPDLARENLEPELSALLKKPVHVLRLSLLGEKIEAGAIKGYGYGMPVLVEYEVDGQRRKSGLETLSPGLYGHDDMAGRSQMLLGDFQAYTSPPRHARSLDVGAFQKEGALLSLGKTQELFLLTEYVEGTAYIHDLSRLQENGRLTGLDLARVDVLCDYLAEIHDLRGPEPGLYSRRIRELMGHGECIMGITDGYPPKHGFITSSLLEDIERRCVGWRWRIKGRAHRLRRVHGDFHPYNILFRDGMDFSVLNRSRGEWGDPADDVT